MLTWRVILFAAAAVLVAAFVACGGGDDETAATGSASPGPAASTPASEPAGTIPAGVEGCPPQDGAASLVAAGSPFVAPLVQDWLTQYETLCNVDVTFQASGSGQAITQFASGAADFAVADMTMTAAQESLSGPVQHIPVTAEAVAIVYNIEGVSGGALTLDGETLAGIFLGTIADWQDPAIAELNPGLALPDGEIAVINRTDTVGSTNILTSFLSKVSTQWTAQVGAAPTVQWPIGTGVDGNAAMASALEDTPDSIGYVTLSYALQNGLDTAGVENASGSVIQPTLETARAAQTGFDFPDDMKVSLANPPGATAYPITGFTWMIVRAVQADEAKAKTIGSLAKWMLSEGQGRAESVSFVRLSEEALVKANAQLAEMTFAGTPVLELE